VRVSGSHCPSVGLGLVPGPILFWAEPGRWNLSEAAPSSPRHAHALPCRRSWRVSPRLYVRRRRRAGRTRDEAFTLEACCPGDRVTPSADDAGAPHASRRDRAPAAATGRLRDRADHCHRAALGWPLGAHCSCEELGCDTHRRLPARDLPRWGGSVRRTARLLRLLWRLCYGGLPAGTARAALVANRAACGGRACAGPRGSGGRFLQQGTRSRKIHGALHRRAARRHHLLGPIGLHRYRPAGHEGTVQDSPASPTPGPVPPDAHVRHQLRWTAASRQEWLSSVQLRGRTVHPIAHWLRNRGVQTREAHPPVVGGPTLNQRGLWEPVHSCERELSWRERSVGISPCALGFGWC